MSDYTLLIDLSSEILIERIKCYRHLIIVIAIISLPSVCVAVAKFSFWPLIITLFLLPTYSLFLVLDNSKLNKWRAEVLTAWQLKIVDLNALRQSITVNKALPQHLLQGMLEALPDAGNLLTEQTVSKTTRKALANALIARDINLRRKLICRAFLHTITMAVIVMSVFAQTWIPLSALAIVPIMLVTCNWLDRRNLSKAIDTVMIYRKSNDFNLAKYIEIAQTVNWQGISSLDKQRLLMSESNGCRTTGLRQ